MNKKLTPQQKFVTTRKELCQSLIERHDEIDMVLTALLCQDHPLLVGPPGTGKSFLIDSLMRWMGGGVEKFSVLLGKTSVPDEVYGPLDILQLKAGKYVRVTRKKLPEAHLAFLDEIFKASTAILNSLLKILNERLFDKGDEAGDSKCPLRIALAASNEWPAAEELGALFDRFLLRKTVRPVSRIGRDRLLFDRDHSPKFSTTISTEELDTAHAEAMALELTDQAKDTLREILNELNKEGIVPGDRRMKKSVSIARAFAYLRGADEVRPEHLEVLKYVLWNEASEQEQKCHKIVCRLSNPVGSKITDILTQAASVVETSNPTESVGKLQDLQKQLRELPAHDRKDAALKYLIAEVKRQYDKVIGYTGGGE